jgi:predicted metal-dependent phosphoesterase TrpH
VTTTRAKIDLHLHTTRSDGKLTPTELVRLVASRGVTVAAITDHDSTEGLDEAFEEAAKHPGLRLIAGIEISADHAIGKGDLHILGYFLDYHDRAFQDELRRFRDGRLDGARHMVDKLADLGLPVEFERVQAIARDASIGRPHIAQAMVERGYIKNVKEAFNEYLQDGGKAHIARPHITMEGAVKLIQSVGGVAVLAHPLYMETYPEILPQLKRMGFAGMEVHYGEFDRAQRQELARQADEYGLLCCGGSDYHAFGTPGEHLPGSAGPPESVFQELETLAGQR